MIDEPRPPFRHGAPAAAGDLRAPAPRITIVVPCFNEGSTVGDSLTRLRRWFASDAELLVVDDGSGDDTRAVAARIAASDAGVRVLALDTNAGKGRAVASAAASVRGALVAVVDADLAYGEASIRRVLDALESAPVAIGSRRHEASRYTVPVRLFGFLYRRHLLGMVFNLLVRVALGVPWKDTQCGLKAFRADAFRTLIARLRTRGFAYDIDLLLVARGLGLDVREVPVDVEYTSGRTSVRLLRESVRMAGELARIAARRLAGGYGRSKLVTAADEPIAARQERERRS